MQEPIDKKYLAGLTFRSSNPVKGEGGTRHQPTERELQPEDVLSWADKGATVVIVTADGRKHAVAKKGVEALATGAVRLNAAQTIEQIKAAATVEELEKLVAGEDRKTVLDVIAIRKEELKKGPNE